MAAQKPGFTVEDLQPVDSDGSMMDNRYFKPPEYILAIVHAARRALTSARRAAVQRSPLRRASRACRAGPLDFDVLGLWERLVERASRRVDRQDVVLGAVRDERGFAAGTNRSDRHR